MLEHNLQQQTFVMQVSQLTMQIKSLTESNFSYVEVEGEISGLTYHNSGHVYFTLKDEYAMLSCVFFRHNVRNNIIKLKNGDKIIAKGNISLYPPRGTYSLNVISCAYSGIGNLRAQYDALKKELESRNYFHKNKPLPKYPKKIIFLTSQTGAALQDMIKVAKRRFCACEFILLDTLTQGKEAKYSIAKNLAYADGLHADILVLARGGGSIEDLWSFNEIEVLEAIFACKTPVVSAIGHEIDYLLSDYVADVRAPTPSAAMEMILCDKENLLLQITEMESYLNNTVQTMLHKKKATLQNTLQNIELCNPVKKIKDLQNLQQSLKRMLLDSLKHFIFSKRQDFIQYQHALKILSPSHKIHNLRTLMQSVSQNIAENFSLFLQNKREKYKNTKLLLTSRGEFFLLKQQNMLPNNLEQSILFFLKAKQETILHYNTILDNIHPEKSVKDGFAQILKNNKPVLLKDLNKDDEIELIDKTGIKYARIIS